MKKSVMCLVLAAVVISAIPAFAELQNVIVGGQVRVRGNWYTVDDHGMYGLNDEKFVEQRTKLNVRADFTDQVSAFIEMDSYDWWGEGFRSNYLTGVDSRGAANIDLYQGYIEAKEMFGLPVQLRVGRQELVFGSGWLVGANESGPYFTGLSFDAVRATYTGSSFSVDAFASKLVERSPIEEDGDVDFYGIYASCTAVENMVFDAYWLYVRDAAYTQSDLQTVGLRAAGKLNAFHYEAEVDYQYGDSDRGPYDDENYDNWACNVTAGYFFDAPWKPHPFIGFTYLQGDNDGYSFNRLFSDNRLGKTIDDGHWIAGGTGFPNAGVTNLWLVHGGVTFNPTENLMGVLHLCYATELADDWAANNNGGHLGWELEASAVYHFTSDLSVEAGYAHLFVDDNLKDGSKIVANGLGVVVVPKDVNYFYVETKLTF